MTMTYTEKSHNTPPDTEEAWGVGAIIVRRPEAGDSVLKDLNILETLGDAAIMGEAFRHLDEQEHDKKPL